MKSGFSRRELADIVGLFNDAQVGRHERSDALPSLFAALSYQAIFKVPISELFPGLYETIAQRVEERLEAIESALHDSSTRGWRARITARKIVWLNERRDPTIADPIA
jgi:transcriptional regulator with XRE-family HTH domain